MLTGKKALAPFLLSILSISTLPASLQLAGNRRSPSLSKQPRELLHFHAYRRLPPLSGGSVPSPDGDAERSTLYNEDPLAIACFSPLQIWENID